MAIHNEANISDKIELLQRYTWIGIIWLNVLTVLFYRNKNLFVSRRNSLRIIIIISISWLQKSN
jgi:hypothetical protein